MPLYFFRLPDMSLSYKIFLIKSFKLTSTMSEQKTFVKAFVEWLLGKIAAILLLVMLLFGVAAMLAAGFSPAFGWEQTVNKSYCRENCIYLNILLRFPRWLLSNYIDTKIRNIVLANVLSSENSFQVVKHIFHWAHRIYDVLNTPYSSFFRMNYDACEEYQSTYSKSFRRELSARQIKLHIEKTIIEFQRHQ